MEAYKNSKSQTGRSQTSCGYCRQRGHSIRECPHVEYDYLEWQAFRVPHKSPTLQHNRWLANDYSYWVKQVNKHYPRWKKAQETISPTGKRIPATRKCGFCRGEGHTRKDCPEMATIYANLLQANRNYRQALYDTMVARLGLGVGSVIKCQSENGYYSNRTITEHIGTIIGFNLGDVNVFQTIDGYRLDREYKGDGSVEVMIGEDTKFLDLTKISLTNTKGQNETAFARGNRWNTVELVTTIAHSKQPLDPEWVDRDADAFEWLLKKRNKEWLEEREILSAIDRWK